MKLSKKKEHLYSIVHAYEALVEANWLTGKWDNRRFQLCKTEYVKFTEPMKSLLYKTEKLSRGNVEKRAKYRGEIETKFKEIFN